MSQTLNVVLVCLTVRFGASGNMPVKESLPRQSHFGICAILFSWKRASAKELCRVAHKEVLNEIQQMMFVNAAPLSCLLQQGFSDARAIPHVQIHF